MARSPVPCSRRRSVSLGGRRIDGQPHQAPSFLSWVICWIDEDGAARSHAVDLKNDLFLLSGVEMVSLRRARKKRAGWQRLQLRSVIGVALADVQRSAENSVGSVVRMEVHGHAVISGEFDA